jgi:hypothetical protein
MERAHLATLADAVVPFQNAAKEGLKSKIDAWNDPHMSKAEFLYKLFMYAILPRMVKYWAAVHVYAWLKGDGGDDPEKRKKLMAEYQDMLDSVPKHSQLNYDVVPLGWADEKAKKVLYLRGPETEFERIFGGLADLAYRSIKGKDEVRNGLELMNLAGSQLPGVNPILDPLRMLYDYYVDKQNPYDRWSGGNVLNNDEMTAGGTYAAKPLGKKIWNDMTFGLITRFDLENPYPGERNRIEKVLQWPLISNAVGRWLRVSDTGRRQAVALEKEPENKRRSRLVLDAKETVREMLDGKLSATSEKRMRSREYQDVVFSEIMAARDRIGVDPIVQALKKSGPRHEAGLRRLLESR